MENTQIENLKTFEDNETRELGGKRDMARRILISFPNPENKKEI